MCFEVTCEDFDPTFDDIGSQLKIKQLQREKQDLLQALQLYYRVFFLGEDVNLEDGEDTEKEREKAGGTVCFW